MVLLSHAGIQSAELKLVPYITLKDQYNNNLYFDTTDAEPVRDNISIISPGIRISDRTELLDAFIQSRYDWITYRDNEDLNTADLEHLASMRYMASERTILSIDGSFIMDSMNDRDIETTGLVMGTERRVKKHGGISADYAITEITRSSLSYAFYAEDYKNPDYIDSKTHDINLGFSRNMYSLFPNTIGKINLGYSFYRYPGLQEDNSSATIGLEKRIDERFNINCNLGMRHTVIDFSGVQSNGTSSDISEDKMRTNGIMGMLNLVYNGELVNGTFIVSQEIGVASGSYRTMQIRSVKSSIGKRFTSDFSASLNAGYFQNKTNTSELTSDDIDKASWQIGPSISYKINNDLVLNGSYRYIHAKDYITSTISNQSLIYLRLVWEYPFWL